MSFATRHSKARLPFRVLASVICLPSALVFLIGTQKMFAVTSTLFEALQLTGMALMTAATGFIAISGKAPQWLIPTR